MSVNSFLHPINIYACPTASPIEWFIRYFMWECRMLVCLLTFVPNDHYLHVEVIYFCNPYSTHSVPKWFVINIKFLVANQHKDVIINLWNFNPGWNKWHFMDVLISKKYHNIGWVSMVLLLSGLFDILYGNVVC